MIDWEKINLLLDVVGKTNQYPKLHHLRNAAQTELEGIDIKEVPPVPIVPKPEGADAILNNPPVPASVAFTRRSMENPNE
jgi:hypothetical protein